MTRKLIAAAVAAAAIAAGSIAALPATAAVSPAATGKHVSVGDDFFAPAKVTIRRNVSIRWLWSRNNGNEHNARLLKGPKGVRTKDFRSETGTIGVNFVRKFKVAGTYRFICTIHETVMKMTVIVKR